MVSERLQKSDIQDSARTCMFSQRHFQRQLSACCNYEFEDVIAEVEDVDISAGRPLTGYGLRRRISNRLARHASISSINPGIKKVRELAELTKPVVIAGADQGIQLFTREEIIIAPFWDGRTRQLFKNGVPVEFRFAKEGGIASFYNLGLVKNIDPVRREWALKFLNFTLGPERQVEFSKISNYSPKFYNRSERPPCCINVNFMICLGFNFFNNISISNS